MTRRQGWIFNTLTLQLSFTLFSFQESLQYPILRLYIQQFISRSSFEANHCIFFICNWICPICYENYRSHPHHKKTMSFRTWTFPRDKDLWNHRMESEKKKVSSLPSLSHMWNLNEFMSVKFSHCLVLSMESWPLNGFTTRVQDVFKHRHRCSMESITWHPVSTPKFVE